MCIEVVSSVNEGYIVTDITYQNGWCCMSSGSHRSLPREAARCSPREFHCHQTPGRARCQQRQFSAPFEFRPPVWRLRSPSGHRPHPGPNCLLPATGPTVELWHHKNLRGPMMATQTELGWTVGICWVIARFLCTIQVISYIFFLTLAQAGRIKNGLTLTSEMGFLGVKTFL